MRETNKRAYSGQVIISVGDLAMQDLRTDGTNHALAALSTRPVPPGDDGLQDARKRLQKPSFEPSKPGDVVCSSRDPRRSSQQRGSGPERPSTHPTDSVSFLVPLHMVENRVLCHTIRKKL